MATTPSGAYRTPPTGRLTVNQVKWAPVPTESLQSGGGHERNDARAATGLEALGAARRRRARPGQSSHRPRFGPNHPRAADPSVRGVQRRQARLPRQCLDELVAEVRAGKHVGTTATVGKLLDDYLKNLKRLGRARTTVETYTVHIEKHIRPALGTVRLDKLTPHTLDAYFTGLEAKGLSPRTIRLNHAIVSAALSQGVDWGWLSANPAKRARLAAPGRSTTEALTVDQLRTLYRAALEDDTDLALCIALGAITGCRRGELLGLKWSDVDWNRCAVQVARQWVPAKGGQVLSETTKGGKGRTVFIGAEGIALLKGYKAAKRAEVGREPDGWLLSPDAGTTPLRAKSVTDYVTRLGKRLKIPVHFHSLRHMAATELAHAGVDLPTAAAQLGHSPAVMASTYLHTSDERGAAAGELIASVVGKALNPAKSGQRGRRR